MYKHGTYGELEKSKIKSAEQASTVTVYVGVAPINLVRGYATAGLVNTPVKLINATAKNKIGYSSDWNNFTLCEAVDAHFCNDKGNVGPIYVVNVLDPATHRKAQTTSASLTFTNGVATIESDTIIIDTLAIEDKTENTDYTLSYDFETKTLTIASKGTQLTGEIDATYYEVELSDITASLIIGSKTDGVYTGLSVLERMYPIYGVIPSLVGVPKWSETPSVYTALCNAVQKSNGHWYAYVPVDIPILDGDAAVDTITKAKTWKATNNYNSMFAKPCWPQMKNGSKIYHLSTMCIVEFMRCDMNNDGIPMESCSNKEIPCTAQYFGAAATNQGFDQNEANELNEKGITTVVAWNGVYSLWGPHTGGFKTDADGNTASDVDMLAIFDSNLRIQEYIVNSFQAEWGLLIDKPMTIGLRDTILEREQEKLDGLVAQGALVGTPTVEFLETDNSNEDILNGDFTWSFNTTPAPVGKSFTAKVVCSDDGYDAYIIGKED